MFHNFSYALSYRFYKRFISFVYNNIRYDVHVYVPLLIWKMALSCFLQLHKVAARNIKCDKYDAPK